MAVQVLAGSLATPAGLRDLAQWCLALADEQVPDGAHARLDRSPAGPVGHLTVTSRTTPASGESLARARPDPDGLEVLLR